jgi:hypothetical protein
LEVLITWLPHRDEEDFLGEEEGGVVDPQLLEVGESFLGGVEDTHILGVDLQLDEVR